jgi:hypothetical protein
MSDPLKPNEIINLIHDFERAPGVVEWFIPEIQRKIKRLEECILDEGTPPDVTARMKMERSIWLEVLQLPTMCRKAHEAKVSEIAKSLTRGIMQAS